MFLKKVFETVNTISAEEAREYLSEKDSESMTLLDVRTPEEYATAHIPGAKLIPISELADRLGEIDRDKPVIAY